MDHDTMVEILIADITNRADGAGSDLRFAEPTDDRVWVELEGALDVSALANTILDAFERGA